MQRRSNGSIDMYVIEPLELGTVKGEECEPSNLHVACRLDKLRVGRPLCHPRGFLSQSVRVSNFERLHRGLIAA